MRTLLSFGPVLHKDFVSTGRRWQTHLWRCDALAPEVILVAGVVWATTGAWDPLTRRRA